MFRLKDTFSKAEQNTKLGQLKYKKRQDLGNFGTASGGLEVEYRNKLSKDDKIVTPVNAVGPFHGETIVNEMEKLEASERKEVTCDAILKKNVQSVQGYWMWEGYCSSSR